MNDDRPADDGYEDEPLITLEEVQEAIAANLPAIPDNRSEWAKAEDARRFGSNYGEAPITRDEFNRLSAVVAELRNRMERVETAAERLIRSQWGSG